MIRSEWGQALTNYLLDRAIFDFCCLTQASNNTTSGWRSFVDGHVAELIKSINAAGDFNIWRDLALPVFSALLSVLLGIYAAKYATKHTIHYQESTRIGLESIVVANRILMKADHARTQLQGIRNNYLPATNMPNIFLRIASVPPMVREEQVQTIENEISSLAFILPKEEDAASERKYWQQISNINNLFSNYRLVIDRWNAFTEMRLQHQQTAQINVSTGPLTGNQFASYLSGLDVAGKRAFLLEGERLISSTDCLINEFNDLLKVLPSIVRKSLPYDNLKQYSRVMVVPGEIAQVDSVRPNMEKLAGELGMSEKEVIANIDLIVNAVALTRSYFEPV